MTLLTRIRHGRLLALGLSTIVLLSAGGEQPTAPLATAEAVEGGSGEVVQPEVTLRCDMDQCVVDVSYRPSTQDTEHDLRLLWRTRAADGYPGNRSDTVVSSRHARPDPGDGGETYTARDFLWHSDLRCDDHVQITVRGSGITTTTRDTTKDVPASRDRAHCSELGMTSHAAPAQIP